ncbi:MAG: hypothetical protein R3B94_12520 [Hyphomonas sp.]
MNVFGRSDFSKNIRKGEFALTLHEKGERELVFGLDREKSGGASLVVFREFVEDGQHYVVGRYGTHSDLSIARTAWILPDSARLDVELSEIRIPQHLYEHREAALLLNSEGKLLCQTQSDLWLDFESCDLVDGLPGHENSLLEFPTWRVVSGPPEAIVVHHSIVTHGTAQLPVKYRYGR